MIQCTPEGIPFIKDPLIASSIKMPHRRQVLKALKEIYEECYAQEENLNACANLDIVCRFLGITLEQLATENGN